MNKKLSYEQEQKIIKLKEMGFSSRKIAGLVLGSESKKSTVNDFIARRTKEEDTDWFDVLSYRPVEEMFPKLEYNPEDVAFNRKTPSKTLTNRDVREAAKAGNDSFHRLVEKVESENPAEYAVAQDWAKQQIKAMTCGLKIMYIPDPQVKVGEDLSYLDWIGQYLADKKPDVVVCAGDFFDFPSLSSYDKGKLSFEGRRLKADIEAGREGMRRLLAPMRALTDYKPRMVFTLGNHEERLMRVPSNCPEFDGFIGYELLGLEEDGWEVHDFLKPVEIQGIFFVHYLANPFTGKPYGGSALSQLKNVGKSFVVGHKQTLDVAIQPTIDGKMRLGIIAGASYPFDEGYKGYQGNNHFRGIVMLHQAKDGYADPSFVSLDFLKKRYQG